MSSHYIARNEPIVISATTTSTLTYHTAAGSASFDVVVPTGGTPVKVAVFPTGGVSFANLVVQPGESKVTAPLAPPLVASNLTILTTALYGSGNVYITPIASLPY